MMSKQSISDSAIINGFSTVNNSDENYSNISNTIHDFRDLSTITQSHNYYTQTCKKNFEIHIAKGNESYLSIIENRYGATGNDMRAIANKLKALSIPQEDKYKEIILPQRVWVNGKTYILQEN